MKTVQAVRRTKGERPDVSGDLGERGAFGGIRFRGKAERKGSSGAFFTETPEKGKEFPNHVLAFVKEKSFRRRWRSSFFGMRQTAPRNRRRSRRYEVVS